MASLGNTSVSALLRSANSAASAYQTLQDNQAKQQWNFSAKTQEDYNTYNKYLQDRLNPLSKSSVIADQEKAISLQNEIMTAGSAFRSAERTRMSIAIDEGNATPADKVSMLATLYNQARLDGDYANAQSLRLAYDGAVKSYQASVTAANNANIASAKKSVNESLAGLKYQQSAYKSAFETGKPLADPTTGKVITGSLQTDPSTGLLRIVQDPNGKPIYLNRQEYDQLNYTAMAMQEGYYRGAINAGLDTTGSFSNDLASLQNNSEYMQFKNTNMIAQEIAGQGGYATKIDANGLRSPTNLPLSGFTTDKNGNVVPTYKTTLDQGSLYIPHVDTNTGSRNIYGLPATGAQTSVAAGKNAAGQTQTAQYGQYYDPLSGKLGYWQKLPDGSVQHMIANPDGTNPFLQINPQTGKPIAQAPGNYTPAGWVQNAEQFYGNGAADAKNFVSKEIGTGLTAASSLFPGGREIGNLIGSGIHNVSNWIDSVLGRTQPTQVAPSLQTLNTNVSVAKPAALPTIVPAAPKPVAPIKVTPVISTPAIPQPAAPTQQTAPASNLQGGGGANLLQGGGSSIRLQ